MTIVKICGLTRSEDVAAAVAFGADWLGFIHVPNTPRFCSVAKLEKLLEAVPQGVKRVIVVRDEDSESLDALRQNLSFDFFQFHGHESTNLMSQHQGYPVIGVRDQHFSRDLPAQGSFLLDTQTKDHQGGSGKRFDWRLLERLPEVSLTERTLVAGGLKPENVADLLQKYRPKGVDVSSGVEHSPGIKDHAKIEAFIQTVRSAV
jgi:phosphoribosylanthranilate isomerase